MTLTRFLPLLIAMPFPAAGQVVPPLTGEPVPTSTPVPVAAPTPAIIPPVVPTIIPTPQPTASPAPRPSQASAAVAPRRRQAETAPVVPAIVVPEPSPIASPLPLPTPMPSATASPEPVPAAEPEPKGGFSLPYLFAAVIPLLALLGFFLSRRRRLRSVDDWVPPADEEQLAEPVAAVPTAPIPATLTVTRPRPTLVYHPIRIGLNIVTATVEGEITVTNTSDAAIEAVDVRIALLGVADGHAEMIAGIHREPPARLLTPQFVLAPGESKMLRAIAAIGRDDIAPLSAGGRPIFVPMVAVTMAWASDGYDFRSTQAFAVGIERVDSPRLAPIWLDGPSRLQEGVAARPHGVSIG